LRRKRYIDEKLERYSVIRTLRSVDRSDICVIMIDAKEGVTEQDSKIAGYAHDQGKGMIILVNKWDLIEKDTQTAREFEKEIREELPFLSYAPILFVSVRTGQRIQRLFPLIQTVYNNYQMRISTGVLNEIVNDAILYNPPPTDKGERLKIYYMTQAGVAPPTFVLFVNKADLMHFSYLRYLENQVRNRFGFEGVPLRMEVRAKGS
jgi:GTP-binding protein